MPISWVLGASSLTSQSVRSYTITCMTYLWSLCLPLCLAIALVLLREILGIISHLLKPIAQILGDNLPHVPYEKYHTLVCFLPCIL